MTLRTPPSWLQNGSHPAENDRLTTQALYATTGIIGSGSLAVTQNATPNMSVNIAAGWAAILGNSTTTQGVYVAYNDAVVNAAIATAPASNSRIDLVCLTVNDAFYSGSTNNIVVNVVTGTVAASPVAPATPANSIALAQVLVGTSVTSIVNANITDVRVNTTTNLPVVTLTGAQTLTNKTLTNPIISAISNTGLISLPTATDTLVGRATTDTLTNKTLVTPALGSATATSIVSANDSTFNGIRVGQGSLVANNNMIASPNGGAAITTGGQNTIIGNSAGVYLTTGSYVTAIGFGAHQNGTTTGTNTAVGVYALQNISTAGGASTAIGLQAGQNTTTGQVNAFGYLALQLNTSGSANNAFGNQALQQNLTGTNNNAFGQGALQNSTGISNSAFGDSAGSTITSGGNNTCLGYNAQASSATVSNTITLGNSAVTTLRCQVTSITSLSDRRDKTDIKPLALGLDFVNSLNPVTFEWNMRDGAKVGVKDFGFIAQDLVAVEDSLNMADTLQLTLRENPEKLEATQGRLIPILVKAIQDLSAEVELLKGLNNVA